MIRIDTSSLTRWLNNEAGRISARRQVMAIIATETATMTQRQATTMSVTGATANSINSRYTDVSAMVMGASYSDIPLEYGRRPGSYPPTEALKRWCKLKLGDEKLAFVVARKIAQRGTDKYRKGGPKLLTDYVLKWMYKVLIPQKLDKLIEEYTK